MDPKIVFLENIIGSHCKKRSHFKKKFSQSGRKLLKNYDPTLGPPPQKLS
jgi:hypothetical protein